MTTNYKKSASKAVEILKQRGIEIDVFKLKNNPLEKVDKIFQSVYTHFLLKY